jgi:heme A synthase
MRNLHIFLSHRIGACLMLSALTGVFLWTRYVGDKPPAWYPRCPVYAITGWYCPGCGSARMLHALAHGEFQLARRMNIFALAVLPLLGIWGGVTVWRGLAHNAPPFTAPNYTAVVFLIVIIVFTILRNLPWEPFSQLAPSG